MFVTSYAEHRKLATITVIGSDGVAHEMHVDCPYAYASALARRHCDRGQKFKYQVEVRGEVSGPYSADEIIARAFLKKEYDCP